MSERTTKQLVVPHILRDDVLPPYHDSLTSGSHQRIERTFHHIREQYYWQGMYADVAYYVMSCVDCQQAIRPIHAKKPPLQPLSQPSRFHVDVLGPLSQLQDIWCQVYSALRKRNEQVAWSFRTFVGGNNQNRLGPVHWDLLPLWCTRKACFGHGTQFSVTACDRTLQTLPNHQNAHQCLSLANKPHMWTLQLVHRTGSESILSRELRGLGPLLARDTAGLQIL